MLACWDEVLQLGLVAESERDAFLGQLCDLRVAIASGRPAVNVGGLGTSPSDCGMKAI